MKAPELWIEERWPLGRLLDYTGTWSATQRYIQQNGGDPRELIRDEMAAAWGDPDQEREIRWPIMMRAGHPRGRHGS